MCDERRVPVRHTRSEPVFVIGSARSGTTLTCRLLLDHLGVNFGTESQFFLRYFRRLGAYQDLGDDARMRLLIADISRERFFARTRQNFGFVLDAERALRQLRGRTYPDLLRAMFEQFAQQHEMTRWGDKTPAYAADLPSLLQMFPDAQFVHVLRDGRDVAASVFRTPFGPKNAYEAAIAWRRSVTTIWNFGERQPADRFFELRYEHLVEDPVAALTPVARFLGIVDAERVVDGAASRLRAQVRQRPRQSWRQHLAPGEVARFEALAAAELGRAGYELASGPPRRRPGAVSSCLWRMHGEWRRASMPGYWADNWYKFRVRSREALLPMRRVGERTTPRRADSSARSSG